MLAAGFLERRWNGEVMMTSTRAFWFTLRGIRRTSSTPSLNSTDCVKTPMIHSRDRA
jgi:hypothetical protein